MFSNIFRIHPPPSEKSVLGPLDLFWLFLTFFDLFHCFIPFIHWFMIDLSDLLWLISPRPPAGGGIRTCDLVVERSVCNPTGLYPSLPPSGTQNTLFFEGSPFCHHEGRHKRWEFLNRCTFRFRSTPSFFCPTQKIGFGAGGRFCTILYNFSDF